MLGESETLAALVTVLFPPSMDKGWGGCTRCIVTIERAWPATSFPVLGRPITYDGADNDEDDMNAHKEALTALLMMHDMVMNDMGSLGKDMLQVTIGKDEDE
jgi:hypothetical protein